MIYFIQDSSSCAIKIGMSGKPLSRLTDLQTAHHARLVLVGVMDGGRYEEQVLHSKFDRRQGEWFDPSTALLSYIRDNAITPQSMGFPSVGGPLGRPQSVIVRRLCFIRDIVMLIFQWVLVVTTATMSCVAAVLANRAGDGSYVGTLVLSVFITLVAGAVASRMRALLLR